MEDLLVLVPLVVSLVSLVASLTLLIWVCRLKLPLRRRLLARQVWHLALADVLASLEFIGLFVGSELVARGVIPSSSFDSNSMTAMVVSALFEVHIALTSVVVAFRCFCMLRVLAFVLPGVWFLGILVEVANINTSISDGVWVAIAVVISAAAYLVGMAVVWRDFGGAVQRRAGRQAHWFVAASIVTWGPYLMLSLGIRESSARFYVAQAFRQSNGLMNAAVYALLSRFVRRMRRRARSPSAQSLDRSSPVVSWHVGLPSDEEVYSVAAMTDIANRNAEEAIASLETNPSEDGDDDSDAEDDFLACFDQHMPFEDVPFAAWGNAAAPPAEGAVSLEEYRN